MASKARKRLNKICREREATFKAIRKETPIANKFQLLRLRNLIAQRIK